MDLGTRKSSFNFGSRVESVDVCQGLTEVNSQILSPNFHVIGLIQKYCASAVHLGVGLCSPSASSYM